MGGVFLGFSDFLNASGKLNIMFLIVVAPPTPFSLQGIILIYKWYRIYAKCEEKTMRSGADGTGECAVDVGWSRIALEIRHK